MYSADFGSTALIFLAILVTPAAYDLWGCVKGPLSPEFLQARVRLFNEFSEAAHCLPVLFGIKFPKAKVLHEKLFFNHEKF